MATTRGAFTIYSCLDSNGQGKRVSIPRSSFRATTVCTFCGGPRPVRQILVLISYPISRCATHATSLRDGRAFLRFCMASVAAVTTTSHVLCLSRGDLFSSVAISLAVAPPKQSSITKPQVFIGSLWGKVFFSWRRLLTPLVYTAFPTLSLGTWRVLQLPKVLAEEVGEPVGRYCKNKIALCDGNSYFGPPPGKRYFLKDEKLCLY